MEIKTTSKVESDQTLAGASMPSLADSSIVGDAFGAVEALRLIVPGTEYETPSVFTFGSEQVTETGPDAPQTSHSTKVPGFRVAYESQTEVFPKPTAQELEGEANLVLRIKSDAGFPADAMKARFGSGRAGDSGESSQSIPVMGLIGKIAA